jgi:hypothetical protein
MMFSNVHKNTSPFMLSKKQQKNIPEQPAVYKAPAPAPAPVMFGFSKQYLAANRKIVEQSTVPRVLPPPPPVVSDGAKMRWGKPIWTFFHLLAHKVKDEDFNLIRLELLNNIYAICSVLPCPICSDHAKRYLQSVNFNNIRTKQDLKILIYNFHNDVNKNKGYASFNAVNLDETYDAMNFVNAINQFIFHFEDKHRSAKLMADDMMRTQISNKTKTWIRNNIQHFSP